MIDKAVEMLTLCPPSATEEYRRPVTAGPLPPSDYSRGSTLTDDSRAIKRRIKPTVSAIKLYIYSLGLYKSVTARKTIELF